MSAATRPLVVGLGLLVGEVCVQGLAVLFQFDHDGVLSRVLCLELALGIDLLGERAVVLRLVCASRAVCFFTCATCASISLVCLSRQSENCLR